MAVAIDPARLASGEWSHQANKTIGQGDISASYSGDRIGMGQPIRNPFTWQGGLWVCVCISGGRGRLQAEAYRLCHRAAFSGHALTYREKTADGDAARSDENGFYHGMIVRHAGEDFVLNGPPEIFIPGQTVQFSLF